MKKLIIFDLDGTLLNTIDDITMSVNETLIEFGYPKRTAEEVMYFLGDGPKILIEKSFDKKFTNESEFKEIFNFYDNRYKINQNLTTKPYSDINKLLMELKKDYKLAVCSNKQNDITKSLISEIFPETFDVVVGANPMKRKPAPDMVYYILDELNIKKEDTLFVGDTKADINTGINAGVEVIAVLWGFRKRSDLEHLNPNYFVETPLEILDILKSSFNK